jgi:hypothetical protein
MLPSGTLVSFAPMTVEETVLLQLHSAREALADLRDRWIPRLANAAMTGQIAAPMTVIRARRALAIVADAIARTASLAPAVRSFHIDALATAITAERDTLAPIVGLLIAPESHVRPEPTPDPNRQRAVTAQMIAIAV